MHFRTIIDIVLASRLVARLRLDKRVPFLHPARTPVLESGRIVLPASRPIVLPLSARETAQQARKTLVAGH